MHKPLAVFLSLFLIIAGLAPAHAQTAARLSLFDLDLASFPSISSGLDVFNSSGSFVTGLTPADLTLLEDNQPRLLTSLEELQPGTEFALALDPSPFFAYRDTKAITRYDKVMRVLNDWTAGYTDSLGDDLSFLPAGGAQVTHLANMADFKNALVAYQPDLWKAVSSPEMLARALEVVSEPTSQMGRKPVVLYITSIPAAGDVPALNNLTQRAADGHIRVFVWIVASSGFFSTTGVTALNEMARLTGGQVVLFTGDGQLPSPEVYLAPLRHTYHLVYSSGIITSGAHTLIVQSVLDGGMVSAETLTFDLDVQPPNPILVDPPDQIVRSMPDEQITKNSIYLPSQQQIEVIIEFQDGRTRPLTQTRLYVDGVLEDENTAEPFDQFTWDLSSYLISGRHVLTVEAEDTLGLSKFSLGIPVLVTVVQPKVGLIPWLSRNSLWVALGAALFAGGVLVAILVSSVVKKRRLIRLSRGSQRDPLTQLIPPEEKKRNLHIPWARSPRQSEATLVRLKDNGQTLTAPPIPVTTPEMIFGSDPIKATRILDDTSVSPLHARLTLVQGKYILKDERSIAGTWVNFERVTTQRILQHGDLLHFGRVSYRFMLRKPPERPAPQVLPARK